MYSHSGIRSNEGTFTGFFFSRFTLKTGLVWRIDPFQPWEKVFRQREISNFPNCPSPVLSAHWRTSLQFEKYGAFKKHVQSLFYFIIFFFEGCASKNFDTKTLRGLKSPLWNPPSSLLFPDPPLFPTPPPPPFTMLLRNSLYTQYTNSTIFILYLERGMVDTEINILNVP